MRGMPLFISTGLQAGVDGANIDTSRFNGLRLRTCLSTRISDAGYISFGRR